MRTTTIEKLVQLQKNPRNVRNICILAHVDHGKTTLADALVASNGIISQRMAGKLRYMDSREDEQIRGITMKSSAISLHFQQEKEEYLVNLIDSPGHVDFSSEVSTAVRLCDGAIVMVDVVEGVCPQTHAVLRQAWLENIKPILVLNKIDRLITELKMETLQAFIHLQQILEQVNLVTSGLFTADVMSMQSSETTNGEATNQQTTHDWTEDADEFEDRNIYFSPDQGNVVFASALDGWGFTIAQFAELYSKKLGMSESGLKRTLWGDYYLNMKTKRVTKGAQSKGKKPLFVQFVLESIWSVYGAVQVRRDKDMIEKIVTSLNLKIAVRDSRHNDPRVLLTAITSQWLPISRAVLGLVVEKLPSPLDILEDKVEKLMCSQAHRFDSLPKQTQELKQDFLACSDKDDVPVIVFVSKMVPVEKKMLPQNKQRMLTEEELQKRREEVRRRHAARLAGTAVDAEAENQEISQADGEEIASKSADSDSEEQDHVFVAFARVFSGTIRKGQKLYVLGPKHNPAKALEEMAAGGHIDGSAVLKDLASDQHITMVTVKNLYLFMGRELETLDAVSTGNVLGIGGLEDHILKSGTVSSTVACPAFTDLYFDAVPILRVALEPTHAGDMKHLVRGLKLLNQADPCVQVFVQETGEHVIITAGEVHLRRCLDDLIERYAKVEITASKPIVSFRETIIPPPTVDMVNESIQDQNQITRNERWKEFEEDEEVLEEGLVRIYTPSKSCMVQIRAKPLPPDVADILEKNQFLIRTLDQYVSAFISEKSKSRSEQRSKLKDTVKEEIKEFKEKLEKSFSNAGKKWKNYNYVDKIWAFGPKRVGPNLLINKVDGYDRISFWNCLESDKSLRKYFVRDYDYSIVCGFQLATLTGPLCDEPLRGVCFIIEKWEILTDLTNAQIISQSTSEAASEETNSMQSLQTDLENINLEDTVSNEGSQIKSCDSEVLENEDENEHSDQVPPIVSRRKRQRSCRVSESGSIHDLDIEKSGGLDLNSDSDDDSVVSGRKKESHGHLSGQLISIVKDGCRKAFQTQAQRLMVAMYKCTIQCTAEALGKLYAVIGKRNGRITGDDMREGTQMFSIEAVIPVVESFGFAEDIRKKTSGLASPQLVFSHWEVLDVDPYWVPRTEEEIMHYGEKADTENRALTYMNNVRERKGLKVDKKIVEHAEKQRTLTKMK